MMIEFVGLMGAGKTTLFRQALDKLERRGSRTWTSGGIGTLSRPPFRYVARLRSSWHSRTLTLIAVRHILASGRRTEDKLKGLRWFLTDLGSYWAARQHVPGDHVVVFDEGLLQRAMNLFIHGRGTLDVDGVREYARAVPLPDVLIHVRVDPGIAKARALSRPYSLSHRFRGLTDHDLQQVFSDAALAMDTLVDETHATRGREVKILTIDANDLEQAALALGESFDQILASPCRTGAQMSHFSTGGFHAA